MKIAVFHNLPEGGAKIALFEQVKRLAKSHTLDLFTFVPETGEYDLSCLCRKTYLYPYEVVESTAASGLPRVAADVKSFTRLRRVNRRVAGDIDKQGYDFAFVHQCRLTHAPYLLKYLQKTPSLYYCQEPLRMVYESNLRLRENVGPLKSLYETVNRRIRKTIDAGNAKSAGQILVSSNYIKGYVKTVYQKDAWLSPLGVDTNVFKPQEGGRREGILYLGRKNRTDGYRLLEKALSLIPENLRPKLTIIEPGREKFKYPTAQIAVAYASSEFTVCPAILEPFGLSALESMASATPAVAADQGGYRETVIDGATGYLLPRQPRLWAEKISYLHAHRKIAEAMGLSARNEILRNWTWDRQVRYLEKLMDKFIKGEK